MDVHLSALKHGVEVEDIDHAVRNAMAVDELDDDGGELVIHAMVMRSKYRRLLPRGDDV